MQTPRNMTDARCAGAQATGTVRPVAPEEIRTGDYLVVLRETFELPLLPWCRDPLLSGGQSTMRLSLIPEAGGLPRRAEATYLPYVLTRTADGQAELLDVRRHHLARVRKATARAVWQAVRKAGKQRRM